MTTHEETKTAAITTPTDREIHVVREFAAPRDRVFAVYTDPELIPQWWGPRGTTAIEHLEDRDIHGVGAHLIFPNILLAAKADTVAEKQFEVARNRYIIGKITNTDLYTAQDQKDQAILAYVQALRNYWTSYYHLRRVTLYDFSAKSELSDVREK